MSNEIRSEDPAPYHLVRPAASLDRMIMLDVAWPRGSAGDWAYSYTHTVIDKLLDRVFNG